MALNGGRPGGVVVDTNTTGDGQTLNVSADEFFISDAGDFVGEVIKGTTINELSVDALHTPLLTRFPIQLRAKFVDSVERRETADVRLSSTRLAVSRMLAAHPGSRKGSLSYDLQPLKSADEFRIYAGRKSWMPFWVNLTDAGPTLVRLKFEARHFRVFMERPSDGMLFDGQLTPADFASTPLLINSVQYGRLGFAVIESDDNYADVSASFAALFAQANGGVRMTAAQEAVISRCRILNRQYVHVDGSALLDLPAVILRFRQFTDETPGGPISFTAQHVQDFTPFVNHYTVTLRR